MATNSYGVSSAYEENIYPGAKQIKEQIREQRRQGFIQYSRSGTRTKSKKKETTPTPAPIVWTGTQEQWQDKQQTQEQKKEIAIQNLETKRALPVTTVLYPLTQGKLTIEKPKDEYIGYRANKPPTDIFSKLRKSGDIDLTTATKKGLEGKYTQQYFSTAVGETKKFTADFLEGTKRAATDPRSAMLFGGTLLLTKNPKAAMVTENAFAVATPVFVYSELDKVRKDEKTIGSVFGEFAGYGIQYKALSSAKPYFSETKLDFEGYHTQNKNTYIGKGTIKGEKSEVVIIEKPDITTTYIRTGETPKKITITKPEPSKIYSIKGQILDERIGKIDISTKPTKIKNVELSPDITITTKKPNILFEGKEGVLTNIKTLEPVRITGKINQNNIKGTINLNQIISRDITVTPGIEKTTQYTKKDKIINIDYIEPTIEFGAGKTQKSFGKIKFTKEGFTIEQYFKPEAITKTSVVETVGRSKFTFYEKSDFSKIIDKTKNLFLQKEKFDFKNLGIETITFDKPTKKIIDLTKIKPEQKTIETKKQDFDFIQNKKIGEKQEKTNIDKIKEAIKPETKQKLIQKEKLIIKPITKQDIKITIPQFSFNNINKLDISPIFSFSEKTGQKLDFNTKQKPEIKYKPQFLLDEKTKIKPDIKPEQKIQEKYDIKFDYKPEYKTIQKITPTNEYEPFTPIKPQFDLPVPEIPIEPSPITLPNINIPLFSFSEKKSKTHTKKRKLKPTYKPSLTGLFLNIKTPKLKKKTLTGFELRGI